MDKPKLSYAALVALAVAILSMKVDASAAARKGGHFVGGHEVGEHVVHHPIRRLLRHL